jgi:hypothetical protein
LTSTSSELRREKKQTSEVISPNRKTWSIFARFPPIRPVWKAGRIFAQIGGKFQVFLIGRAVLQEACRKYTRKYIRKHMGDGSGMERHAGCFPFILLGSSEQRSGCCAEPLRSAPR